MNEPQHEDQAPNQGDTVGREQPDFENTETLAFYRELRAGAIKSAHTGSPLSLLVFEPASESEAAAEGRAAETSCLEDLRESLQAGLKDCEKLVACGANALFMILLGSELAEAEQRVADLHQTIQGSDGSAQRANDRPTIGVAQRQDCEPLSHFVHRTRSALRSA